MIEKYEKSHWNEHHLYQNMSRRVVKRSEYGYVSIFAFVCMSNLYLFLCF